MRFASLRVRVLCRACALGPGCQRLSRCRGCCPGFLYVFALEFGYPESVRVLVSLCAKGCVGRCHQVPLAANARSRLFLLFGIELA